MSKKPEHLLVIRLSAMGDVAMTVPVLRALTNQYPALKITVLTKAFFKPMFRDLANVSVVEADIKGEHKGVLGLYKLSKTLKKTGLDSVADLHNVLRSNILKFFFFGKKVVQIDKGRAEKKALISGKIFEQLKTTHQRYADVFEHLGYLIDLSNPKFPEPSKLTSKSIDLIGNDSKSCIGIAPFAAFKGKAYPLPQMQIVIEALSEKYKILLFGANGAEANQLQIIADKNDNVINLAGKLNFNDELDIISNLKLMISMDSGNAHLAAMQGVKVLTVWGVTHPFAGFSPFNQDLNNAVLANRVQYPKIPTSVYGNSFPIGYDSIFSTISPEDILDKIKMIIK
ncbi:glycosyltransferase family 9 protein [Psychroserpens ponticola]|uniref:Glycosyltransferase family 9 protein n=1 Tax=Psychroserpens ponticola TaxID=2932268 RepID=A0ABY7RY57_9FLAO|nr:glycosyltransferase family 9 protein [Psychroserpens ponticola]WCO01626.1 glycosyltransferase family 9 protein [Psychroserpens ponticola]